MTPAEAEAEASRLGLPKLAKKPDPAEFDPMKEPSWTLIMALAWIMWRTPDAVRNHWDAYRVECEDWVSLKRKEPQFVNSSYLERRKVATVAPYLRRRSPMPTDLASKNP
jgi:hypothetical protein